MTLLEFNRSSLKVSASGGSYVGIGFGSVSYVFLVYDVLGVLGWFDWFREVFSVALLFE